MNKSQIPSSKPQENPKSQAPRENNGKPYDIRQRTFQFAVNVLKCIGQWPDAPGARVVRDQLGRAASSIGANVEEADGALSRADVKRIYIIARKEARETRYWLRIAQDLWGSQTRLDSLIDESTEILRILSSIIQKL